MYSLTDLEILKLKNGIKATYAVPFIDDVEDFIWEAIFSYVRNIPIVDPLNNIRKKLLYDIVDNVNSIGWSAKTLQISNIAPGSEFELVIQRADILRKSEKLGYGILSRSSDPSVLGSALLKHWYLKVNNDAITQDVTDKRVCILIKSNDRTKYAYYEDDVEIYKDQDIRWEWTGSTRTGLKGIRRKDDFCIYRWYPNQTHFFERFTFPQGALIFELTPQRLQLSELVGLLLDHLEQSNNS